MSWQRALSYGTRNDRRRSIEVSETWGLRRLRTGDGLVVSGWLLPANALWGHGQFRPDEGVNMQQHSLENSIRTLEKLRDVYNSQLDTSVLTELNIVISDLKKVSDNKESEMQLGILSLRAIQIIATIISLVSNLKDLIK